MKKCNKCQKTYDDSWSICFNCNTKLDHFDAPPEPPKQEDIQPIQKDPTHCPYCKETIKEGAIKCKHCGEILKKNEYTGTSNVRSKVLTNYSVLPEYYQKAFKEFDQNNGEFSVKFKWMPLLFGLFWYYEKGMWMKATGMLFLSFFLAGVPAPFFWVYCGIAGNYDYYLHKVKGKQLW